MVNTFRLRAKRTTGSTPPDALLFGELAYSDANQQLYVGRADGEQPPATFGGNPIDYGPAIATLSSSQAAQDSAIAALTISDAAQDSAIAALTTSDAAQDSAIAALTTSDAAQDSAIAALTTSDADQDSAIAALTTDLATLTTSDVAQDSAIATLSSSQAAQDTAIAALQALPVSYGFTYDQQAEPSNPAPGATWRERSSGGLILGEWTWDNEALRWVELVTRSQLFNVSGTGAVFTPFVAAGIWDPLGTILYLGFKGVFWINTTANSSNRYEQRLMSYQKEPASDSITTGGAFTLLTPYSGPITIANANVPYSVTTKQLISRPGGLLGFRSWVDVVGSPGSFRSVGSVLFKNVRPI